MNPAPIHLRQQLFQFAETHQRISTHEGHMQRAVLVDQAENALHQRRTLVVRQLTERDARQTQMPVFVGVAPRASERTLAGEFDRNGRTSAAEYGPPRCITSDVFTNSPVAVSWLGVGPANWLQCVGIRNAVHSSGQN